MFYDFDLTKELLSKDFLLFSLYINYLQKQNSCLKKCGQGSSQIKIS